MDDKTEPSTNLKYDESVDDNASQDDKDMAKLGKKQQFRRHFDFFSILGFACMAMVTWEGYLVVFVYGLENGGPAGLIYGSIFVWLGYATAVISLAELMSMWPTSGGQYHWCYMLSPPKIAPILSYIAGWQSVIAWQAGTASATYLTATMIQGLAVLNYPSYGFERWHGTLIMYAVLAWAVLFGTFCNRQLPKLDYAALFLHFAGFIVVVVVVAVLSPTKASNHEVFGVWLNNGYSSQGVSFLAGLQGCFFAWIGADAPVHMAEEVKNAARIVPWAMISSIVLNGIMGLGLLLVVLYYGPTGDALMEALGTPTGYPYLAIFTHATGSTGGTTGLAVIICLTILMAVLTLYTAASRELWAFARDNGVPGATWLGRVNKNVKLPLWSMLVTATITILLALINIGSSVAFNAIISLTVAAYSSSYVLPIGLVLWRRIQALRGKGPELPWGPWRLGIWGIVINGIAVCWITIIFIFSFFPIEPLPALTVQTMNWSSLAYGAITIFAVAFWLVHGKRTYKGPVRDAADGEIETILDWKDVVARS